MKFITLFFSILFLFLILLNLGYGQEAKDQYVVVGKKYPSVWYSPFDGEILEATNEKQPAPRFILWIEPNDPEFSLFIKYDEFNDPKNKTWINIIGNTNSEYEKTSFQTECKEKLRAVPPKRIKDGEELVFVCQQDDRQVLFQILDYDYNEKDKNKSTITFRSRELRKGVVSQGVARKIPESIAKAIAANKAKRAKEKQAAVLKKTKVDALRKSLAKDPSLCTLNVLMLAVFLYETECIKRVSDIKSKKGKPLLSWRVRILPHIGEEKLYEQFHLNEPWDSPHNLQLVKKMPDVFKSPNGEARKTWKSSYQKVRDPAYHSKETVDEPDGTIRTIRLVEVNDKHATIWTKPDADFILKEGKGILEPLKGVSKKGFLIAFVGDMPKFLNLGISPDAFRSVCTVNGGKDVRDLLE